MKRQTNQHRFRALLWLGGILLAVPAAGLSLDPNTGVVPRIFSPNGDGINDVTFFQLDNPSLTEVSGVILDMTGAEVSSLVPAPGGVPTVDSLMWDGRDRTGRVVRPGPYIYRIEGDGKTLSGVLAVVK
ncbi:MAG: hypothetical protein IPP35_06010 [Elusimicrobia bacterium]|nr:hypothetical protein [Elusimicrobiota bacterium]